MKYRFLIYYSYSYAFPIGKPLEAEIKRRGFEVKWFCDTKETIASKNENFALIADIRDVIIYEPHIVLCITNVVADFISGIKVQIFHGFSANKRSPEKGHFKIRGFFDLYCTQGPSTTKPFRKLQKRHKHFKVKETGWSKVDPLFPIEASKQLKPTILISSTFSRKTSMAYQEGVIAELERISKLGKWKFMLILHPKMETDKFKEFSAIQNEHLTFYNTTDIIPLFKKADVMFSDTTSAIIEFILQEKPVVTFRNNKPGPHLIDIKSIEKIEPALERAIQRPAPVIKAIQEYIQITHPYSDGKSSERVIDACISFLYEDKSYLEPKPLNLIRKYKVRKQLGYFTLNSYRRPITLKP